MSVFSPEVVAAVVAHMNDDHRDDSLRIVQAYAAPQASAAEMSGLDEDGGLWKVTVDDVVTERRIAWPGGRIGERAEIRREVVALHEQACLTLDIVVPPH